MSKPYRLPADPKVAIKQFLATELAPVTVRNNLPRDYSKAQTAGVVFDDGGLAVWPVATRPTIRVTVWAGGETAARAVAGQALGKVMSAQLDGFVFRNPSAILEDRDPNNGADMASFTVSVLARTTAGA